MYRGGGGTPESIESIVDFAPNFKFVSLLSLLICIWTDVDFVYPCITLLPLLLPVWPSSLNHSFIHCWETTVRIYISRKGPEQLSPTEKPGIILTRVRVPDAARDFSPRVNFQCIFLRCLYIPRVQLHAPTAVRTLKTPSTRSHTNIWTHENTVHTDRNG